jgi:ornithine cyclodeaminase
MVCASTAQAVHSADIVTTLTEDKTLAQIITPDMVRPGMHFNAVGGDYPGKTGLHRGVLKAASVFVEFEPQTRIEGDLQQMPAEFQVVELWRVWTGQAPGRQHRDGVTVFDSVGFALEDLSALVVLWETALAYGLGQPLRLVATAPGRQNLFGLLAQARATPSPCEPQTLTLA